MDQFDSQGNLKFGFIKELISGKIFRSIIYTFSALSLIIALGLGGLLIRLSFGPISLEFLRPHLESPIAELRDNGINLEVGSIEMAWERWLRPYEIVIKDVTLSDTSLPEQTLNIPEIGLSFYVDELILGRTSIKAIYVYEPKLILDLGQDSGLMLKFNGDGESPPLELKAIYPYLVTGDPKAKLGIADYISKIKIIDAKLTIKEHGGSEFIKFPRLSLGLDRYANGFRIQAELKPRQAKLFSGKIQAELRHRIGSDKFDFNLKLSKTNLSNLIKKSDEEKLIETPDTTLNKILSIFDSIDTNWTGDLHLAISPETFNIFEGKLNLSAGAGNLFINDDPAVLQGLKLHANLEKNRLHVEIAHFNPEIASLSGQITYDFPAFYLNLNNLLQNKGKISAKLKFHDVRAQDLDRLWPKDAAPISRKWIVANITDGIVKNGNLVLQADIGENGKLDYLDYNSDLKVGDATIHYFGELSPLVQVDGDVQITPDLVSIDTSHGMVENTQMTKGIVHIKDLEATPGMLVADLAFEGELKDMLKVIDHKPLEHPRKAHIDLDKTKGHGNLNLNITFDLDENNKDDDLKIEATGEFKDIETYLDIKKLPITYAGESATVSIKDDKLLVKSEGVLNKLDSKLRIDGFVNNKKNNPWSVKVSVDMTPTVEDFKQYGFDYTDYAQGDAPTSIAYTQLNESKAKIDMNLDLTQTAINAKPMGWQKAVGAQGNLVISAALIDGNLTSLDKFSIQDGFLNASGVGGFSENGDLNLLNLTTFKAPGTDSQVKIEWLDNGGYRVIFSGQSVNAEDFMRFLDEEKRDKTDHDPIPIEIKSNVSQLIMGQGKVFSQVDSDVMVIVSPGNVDWQFVHLNTATGKGQARGHKGRMADTAGGISFDLSKPDQNNIQTLEIRANDAGQLFRNLGIYEQVTGGRMVVKASRKVGNPFEGVFKLKEFDATGIPIAGRMAAALSPTGIFNLFSSDNRIYVDDFRCNFTYDENLVTFWDGAGKSLSIGFSTKGKMDRVARVFDIKGEIIPAYVINSVLDNIPILGSLLNGGSNSGLFAVDYTITGSFDEPVVNTNPLTALAPGFIKNLFNWSD